MEEEGDGGKESDVEVEEKPRESCEPMKMTMPRGHTSDVFHRLVLPSCPALLALRFPRFSSSILRLLAESEFRNNRTRKSEREAKAGKRDDRSVAVHTISGILEVGEEVERRDEERLRGVRRGIIISRDGRRGRLEVADERIAVLFLLIFFATLLLLDNETRQNVLSLAVSQSFGPFLPSSLFTYQYWDIDNTCATRRPLEISSLRVSSLRK